MNKKDPVLSQLQKDANDREKRFRTIMIVAGLIGLGIFLKLLAAGM